MTDRLSFWRPAIGLGLVGLAAAVLLAGLNQLTAERIEQQRRAQAMRAVASMLEQQSYDNQPLDEVRRVDIPGLATAATVHVARLGERPVAAVFDVTTGQGYSGDIRLLVGIDMDGTVTGIRVLEHRETPGLGDRIERDKSDWLKQFDGKSLRRPPAEDWRPDRRDGAFDTVTSATITSSAVIDAVRRTLEAFESDKQEVLSAQGDAEGSDNSG